MYLLLHFLFTKIHILCELTTFLHNIFEIFDELAIDLQSLEKFLLVCVQHWMVFNKKARNIKIKCNKQIETTL